MQSPQVAVITNIEGGVKSNVISDEIVVGGRPEDSQRGLGIVKTVRIEHSYR